MNVDAYLAAVEVEAAARAVKEAIRDGEPGDVEAFVGTLERRLHRLRMRLDHQVSAHKP